MVESMKQPATVPCMWRVAALALIAPAVLALAACTPVARPVDTAERLEIATEVRDDVEVAALPLELPMTGVTVLPREGPSFDIPLAFVPPPGTCRIWQPELSPNHQAPPGPCDELERDVPEGAVLIYG